MPNDTSSPKKSRHPSTSDLSKRDKTREKSEQRITDLFKSLEIIAADLDQTSEHRAQIIQTNIDEAENERQGILSNPIQDIASSKKAISTNLTNIINEKDLIGYVATPEAVTPSFTTLTPIANESLVENKVIARDGRPETPALLAYTLPFKKNEPNAMSNQLLVEMLDKDDQRTWTDDEKLLVADVVDQLTLALENAHLFNETQAALAETATLYQASAEINSSSSYPSILHILRRYTILGSTSLARTAIYLFTQPWELTKYANREDYLKEQKLLSWAQVAAWSLEANSPAHDNIDIMDTWILLGEKVHDEEPFIVEDVFKDQRIDSSLESIYITRLNARSLCFIPLLVSGKWIGMVTASFSQPMRFMEQDIRRLNTLSSQAAVAIENIRLIEETRIRNEELTTLNRIIASASRSLDIQQVLSEILNDLLEVTRFDAGLISMLDPDAGTLILGAQKSLPAMLVNTLNHRGFEGSLCQHTFRSAQVVKIENLTNIAGLNLNETTKSSVDNLVKIGFRSYLGVPVEQKGKVLGTVCLFSIPQRTINIGLITLMRTVGQQIGSTIENAGLFQQTQSSLAETATLYQANAELNSAQNYEDILDTLKYHTLFREVDKLISISIFDTVWDGEKIPERFYPIVYWTSLSKDNLRLHCPLHNNPLAKLLTPTAPTIIEDIANDPRLAPEVRQLFQVNYEGVSAIFIPLVVGGEWIGIIYGVFGFQAQFDPGETRRLMVLSGQAAIAIQNIHLIQETRRKASQLQTAAEVARDTSSTLSFDVFLERTVNLIRDRFGFYHASVYLINEAGTHAVVRESTGEAGAEMKRAKHSLLVGSLSVVGNTIERGIPVVVNDVNQIDENVIHKPNPLLPDTRAELGVPLKIGQRVIGALDVQSVQVNAFTSDDISVLQTLADQIAVGVENARSYEMSQKAIVEMQKADQLKTQFLANMSHELRTPLNSIIGFSKVILKGIDGPITELQEQDLNAIYNSGQHLLGLITDILDLSKIEAGKMDLAFDEHVDILDLVNSVISTTKGLIKDKPISLKTVISPDLPAVRADPSKIRQVLLNLLSNAAKFTESGTITINVSERDIPEKYDGIVFKPEKVDAGSINKVTKELLIRVIDTGVGISAEDQKKLFQPFSQVDTSLTRRTGGTGLGLSICRRLIELHGGCIGLVSQIGEGSSFYFTLPLTSEKSKPTIHPRKLAVCIDPETQVLNLYKRYFSNDGWDVLTLTDMAEVVQRLLEHKPTIITLDPTMRSPGLDGWELLSQIKKHPQLNNIPVILCSLQNCKERGLSLGAQGFLLKPILEYDLINAAKEFCIDQ